MVNLKKWSSYVAMAVLFLGGGVEYSVILPTTWDYVRSLGGGESLYGLTVAGFSVANLVTAPIYGVLFDRTKKTKYIVLVANLFEISGNAMYFAARNKYMIMIGRFLAGTGAGVGAGVYGELVRITSRKYMTFMFSFFMGMRQFGLVIGPAFNLFLDKCNFAIGPFVVNRLTSPGAFMMLVWVMVELQFLFFFFTLPSSSDLVTQAESSSAPELKENKLSHPNYMSVQGGINQDDGETSEVEVSTNTDLSKESTLLLNQQSRKAQPQLKNSHPHLLVKILWPVAWRMWDLVQEETVVLLFGLFVILFNQSCLATMFVPLDEDLLSWSENSVSLSFSIAGVLIMVAFVIVSLLSHFVDDRYQIICGFFMELFSYSWLLGCVGMATLDTPWLTVRLMVGFFTAIFALPFFTVTSASLYSKILPARIQGFGQGIRRSVLALGNILGPLWAGASITLPHYYIMLAVPCLLLSLVIVLMIMSFPKLKDTNK